jgi:tight adherence protein B
MNGLAAVAAAFLALLVVRHPAARRLSTRLGRRRSRSHGVVGEAGFVALALCAAGLVALVGWGPGIAAVTASAGLVLVTLLATVRSGVRRRARSRRATEIARACELIGSLVAIGYIPDSALMLAAEDCEVLEPVAAAHRVGADVAGALRAAGARPGGEGLVRLGQAWEVGDRTGAALGQALAAVAEAVRRDHEIERVVASELAGPRASGQVLAVLPLVGLAAGFALGAEPLKFFVTGLLGPACLFVGIALACAGMAWTDALVLTATPRPGISRRRREARRGREGGRAREGRRQADGRQRGNGP